MNEKKSFPIWNRWEKNVTGGKNMNLPMYRDETQEWNHALLLYDSAIKEIDTKLQILSNEFKLEYKYNPIEHITSRVKSMDSIAKKIRKDGRELTVENIVKYVNDVAGVRIICSFTSDIYRIADAIAKQSDVKVLKVKDFIINPKPSGYRSYHMIVAIPIFLSNKVTDTKVEIQIRTIAMDFWASLEHKIYYKFEGNAPEHIREELKVCSEITATLDKRMHELNEEVKHISNPDGYVDYMYSAAGMINEEYYGTLAEDAEAVVSTEVVNVEERVEVVDFVEEPFSMK